MGEGSATGCVLLVLLVLLRGGSIVNSDADEVMVTQ